MNPASERVIAWLLRERGTSPDELATVVRQLAEGCHSNNPEALDRRDQLIVEAHQMDKDEDWMFYISKAIELHFEIEAVDATIRNVERIERLRKVIENTSGSKMARRIAHAKVTKIVEEFE